MQLFDSLKQAIASAQAGQIEGIFALVFFGLGFTCLSSLIYQLRIHGWPETTGQLLTAETRQIGPHSKYRPYDTDYINSVAYRYSVRNQTYEGKRLSPWGVTASRNLKALLEAQIKDLQSGQAVPVFYNPRKPSKSFLTKPGIPGLLITGVFAVGSFATPVLIFG